MPTRRALTRPGLLQAVMAAAGVATLLPTPEPAHTPQPVLGRYGPGRVESHRSEADPLRRYNIPWPTAGTRVWPTCGRGRNWRWAVTCAMLNGQEESCRGLS
jgi:hypothetical protein